MAPARRSAPARTTSKAGATPLPKGSRIPQPMLVYWIVRTVFIGALVLFFLSPTILTWATANRPMATPAGQASGGLLFGSLTEPSVDNDRVERDDKGGVVP